VDGAEEAGAEEAALYTCRSDIRHRSRGRRFHNSPIDYNISYLGTKRLALPTRIESTVDGAEEAEEEEEAGAEETALYTCRSDIRHRNRGRQFHNSPIYYNISYLGTKRRALAPRIVPKQLEQQRPELLLQLLEGSSSSLKFL
jgi:hypothetical protein